MRQTRTSRVSGPKLLAFCEYAQRTAYCSRRQNACATFRVQLLGAIKTSAIRGDRIRLKPRNFEPPLSELLL